MKKLFFIGITGLILFEIANIYFIMPMPGSQRMNSLDLAYRLYHWRWVFRCVFFFAILAGAFTAYREARWWTLSALTAGIVAICVFNFHMAADHMFCQMQNPNLADAAHNKVKPEKLVIGLEVNGEARAYPIQFLGYHHQVQDRVGGRPVIATYCTVCRSGRVYAPEVNGRQETFRLVGMDHFNAMLEDATTGSWWRQATGEAVEGPLAGLFLPEIPSSQATLKEWLALHPGSLILQADSTYQEEYDDLDSYDMGKGRGHLTGTDSASWNEKSWIIGIDTKRSAKAYDWNRLKAERLILDKVGTKPVALVLGTDNQSFFAFELPDGGMPVCIRNDTIRCGKEAWNLNGKNLQASGQDLKQVKAYQEFWHSWRTFHPNTTRY